MVDYKKVHESLLALYQKNADLLSTEQTYLNNLEKFGFSNSNELVKQHKRLSEKYLNVGHGIWLALQVLDGFILIPEGELNEAGNYVLEEHGA